MTFSPSNPSPLSNSAMARQFFDEFLLTIVSNLRRGFLASKKRYL
jgi:hypothetical protein